MAPDSAAYYRGQSDLAMSTMLILHCASGDVFSNFSPIWLK